MESKTEIHEGPGGRVHTEVTITLGGRDFTAGGGDFDPVAGVAVGYPVASKDPVPGSPKFTLGIAGGAVPLMPLRLVREYSVRAPGSHVPSRVYCWSGVKDGVRYHGRNSGPGMLLRMRAGARA